MGHPVGLVILWVDLIVRKCEGGMPGREVRGRNVPGHPQEAMGHHDGARGRATALQGWESGRRP